MNVKKAIKKIAVLGIGASMLGATVLGAMAVDLNEYPSPFVADGAFNGMMVVGDDAQPADIIGVTDIAMSLQFSATVTKTVNTAGSAGTSTVVEGDAWEAKTSSKLFELGEDIADQQTVLDDTDLNSLADGTLTNSKGSFDYEQTLTFANAGSNSGNMSFYADYTENDDDVVGAFIRVSSGLNFANYTLTFTEAAETDVDTNDDWEDFHNKKLTILGKEFTITDSDNSSEELTLMGGAIQDTLEEGETKTYTVGDVDYEVTALIVSDTSSSVKFKVNGEVTEAMMESETEILSDGTIIGVREVLSNEAGETSGGDIVEFYLGAEKYFLDDTQSLKVNEETYSDVTVYIVGNPSSDDYILDEIKFVYDADDDYYIGAGMKLSEVMDEPLGLINWDVEFSGLTAEDSDMIELDSAGDEAYDLKFEVSDGSVSLPFAYSYNTTCIKLGEKDDILDEKRLLINVDSYAHPVEKRDYFFLTTGSANDQGDKTFVLQYKGADKISTTENGKLNFKNLATGETLERSFDRTGLTSDLRLGGETFTFGNASAATVNDFNVTMTTTQNNKGKIVTSNGALITIQAWNKSSSGPISAWNFSKGCADNESVADYIPLVTINAVNPTDMIERNSQNDINFTVEEESTDGGDIQLHTPSSAGTTGPYFGYTLQSHEDDDNLYTAFTPYGALISKTDQDNSPDELDIEWPDEQQYAQVFVTSGVVSSTEVSGEGGTVTYEEPVRIDIGAAVLASDVADPTASNVISVGGSCINEVSAELLGLDYPSCSEASGLEPDTAVIKLIENGNNVAVIVAGWNADDTRRATSALSDFKKWQDAGKLKGMEVSVTGTSLVSFDVTPVE